MSYSRILAHATLLLILAAAAAITIAVATLRPPPVNVSVSQPAAPDPANPNQPQGFTVAGVATLEAVPDVAELSATISVDSSSPRDASTRALARQKDAQAALVAAGVPADALSLSQLSLAPQYDPKTSRLRGYQAAVQLTVRTKNFQELPGLMDALGKAGATTMNTAFKVSDLPALKKKVRQMAGAAAKEKAKELASAVGFSLGAIRAVVESPGDSWSWNGTYANAVVTQEAPSVAHGDLQSISLTVTVTYALEA